MAITITVEVEGDRCFCGDKCEYSNYDGRCMLFGKERAKNNQLKTLGQFYRLELCRKLGDDGK